MRREILDALLAARSDGRPLVLVTRLDTGGQALLEPTADDPVAVGPDDDGPTVDDGLLEAAREAVLADRSGLWNRPSRPGRAEVGGDARSADGDAVAGRPEEDDGEAELLLRVYNTPLRMVIVGAVHIAQPLARMASAAGFDVTVVDPRRAFATAERFPDVELVHAWPDEAMSQLAPDHRTAVVTLTHDPKVDDPALEAALGSPAFYVGALGSSRTHGRRLDRLRERGVAEEALERIQGPVGLDIGARTPAEIAVAVLAEVVGTLRGAGV